MIFLRRLQGGSTKLMRDSTLLRRILWIIFLRSIVTPVKSKIIGVWNLQTVIIKRILLKKEENKVGSKLI